MSPPLADCKGAEGKAVTGKMRLADQLGVQCMPGRACGRVAGTGPFSSSTTLLFVKRPLQQTDGSLPSQGNSTRFTL